VIISYQTYAFTLAAEESFHLPPYKGSVFRGGFGAAFRKVVCALRRTECGACLLRSRCPYAYVFETFPDRDTEVLRVGTHEKAPHPFVIEPPSEQTEVYEPGQSLSFNLILIGRGNDYLPYFVYAFEELGKMGIGRGRGRYRLERIEIGDEQIYEGGEKVLKPGNPKRLDISWDKDAREDSVMSDVSLLFHSPARIMYQRSLTSELEFRVLMTSLLRRLLLLASFHCDQSGPPWDHKAIITEAAEIIATRSDLKWRDWERYSARQKTTMKMGGVVGEVTYEGAIDRFLSILKAGEVLHVGKGTAFGLGKYELR
jgi:hypothetical protein